MLWFSLAILSGLYIVVIILVYLLQSHLVYRPFKNLESNPEEIDLNYEDVTINTEDGVKLAGWFIPSDQSDYVLLFCHGNAGNISHLLESLALFHRLGLSTLVFDYRGYGQSEGEPDEEGTYLDSEAALAYLTDEKKISPDRLIILGRSLGGCIAARLATKLKPKATILESTFTSIIDLGSQTYPYLPIRHLLRYHYPTKQYSKEIKSPILFVHSREDRKIPFIHGLKLCESASEPKDFLEIMGSHNRGYFQSGQVYENGLRSFLEKHNILPGIIKNDQFDTSNTR